MPNAKTLAFVAAVLATGASFAAAPPEGSYPQTEPGTAGASRAVIAAEAMHSNEQGRPHLIRGEDRPEFTSIAGQGLSRAEVVADRELWQRSGLATASGGEASPDVHGQDYQTRFAQYQLLRNGPVHAERVRQLAAGSAKPGRS